MPLSKSEHAGDASSNSQRRPLCISTYLLQILTYLQDFRQFLVIHKVHRQRGKENAEGIAATNTAESF